MNALRATIRAIMAPLKPENVQLNLIVFAPRAKNAALGPMKSVAAEIALIQSAKLGVLHAGRGSTRPASHLPCLTEPARHAARLLLMGTIKCTTAAVAPTLYTTDVLSARVQNIQQQTAQTRRTHSAQHATMGRGTAALQKSCQTVETGAAHRAKNAREETTIQVM